MNGGRRVAAKSAASGYAVKKHVLARSPFLLHRSESNP
jgi:hypothetical protein